MQLHSTAYMGTKIQREVKQQSSSNSSSATLPSLLKQCGKAKSLDDGKLLHTYICKYLNVHNTFLGNCLVEMYGDCGDVLDAASTFTYITELNLFSWNILINAYAKNGYFREALQAYHDMQHRGFSLNPQTFVCVLNALCVSGSLRDVWEIHSSIIDNGYVGQVIVCTALIKAYSKSSNLLHANVMFEHIPIKDVVSWNAMLVACTENGSFHDALVLFQHMKHEGFEPNHITYICALDACASLGSLQDARKLYAMVLTSGYVENQIVANALVNMFGKCGSLEEAKNVFSQMPHLDVFSWSTMIAACVQNGHGKEGLDLFYKMQRKDVEPNAVIFMCAIDACGSMEVLEEAKKIHTLVSQSRFSQDLAVVNALIMMYGKCRNLHAAKCVFDQVNESNVVTWNTMISIYVQNKYSKEALDLFKKMQNSNVKPNYRTFVCALDACAYLANLEEGQTICDIVAGSEHKDDLMVNTALINMYGKCGDLQSAEAIFDRISERDVVVWSSMVAAYAQNGRDEDALDLFHQVQLSSVVLDSITYVCALNACSNLSCLKEGLEIHLNVVKMGYQEELQVATALVEMYGKCGSLDSSRGVFTKMAQRDVVMWNSMIAACAQNGNGEEAITLFDEMQQAGVKPDGITFISVLSACNHIGSVEDGRRVFVLMKDHGIRHTAEHHLYMIDVLGRAGHIDDAEALIDVLPSEKIGKLWHSLLGACGSHGGDMKQASHIARCASQADPENPAPYVLLSNLYAANNGSTKAVVQGRHG